MARATIRVDFEGRGSIGPGKVRLLETIAETGSIAAAARALNMSYRRAWLLAEAVSATLGAPATETQTGGVRGGHATLTAPAKAAVAAYRRLESTLIRSGARELTELEALAAGRDYAAAMTARPKPRLKRQNRQVKRTAAAKRPAT